MYLCLHRRLQTDRRMGTSFRPIARLDVSKGPSDAFVPACGLETLRSGMNTGCVAATMESGYPDRAYVMRHMRSRQWEETEDLKCLRACM